MMEFHIARAARERYQFGETLFSFSGNVIFADLAASRAFAHRMNQIRGAEANPAAAVHPGALFAMGLIDEASHALIEYYRRRLDPRAMRDALKWFERRLGRKELDATLTAFVEEFPPAAVHRGGQSVAAWLRGRSRIIVEGRTVSAPNRAIALEEMLLLWLANLNPAFKPFSELFDDHTLSRSTAYSRMLPEMRNYFGTRPLLGAMNLVDMLRAPALASPDSLSGQLAYIREHWGDMLGDAIRRILLALDVLREEEVAIWMRFHPPASTRRQGDSPWKTHGSDAPSYAGAAHEYERFSPDQDWMPTTVLIAKSTFVWLEQLSRQYQRSIQRLDQIPEEELALLAHRGINALWLIGVWERSRASETIKRICGNQDAVASAYSLYDYTIASSLGGEAAYCHLRDRAMAHGVRLASDMVPNHMGIDSPWVINHPEWFLSRPDCPYPAYRFDGPDLSGDGRVEVKIDDHYYQQTDAAVVFRRRDTWTGDTRYVYHGNDGTSFPWNDTAQIDYLNPAAREQVIQTILHVARLFPIIRFDAAMTLAKRHFQRLWFPLPGTGGAIPSRAECSLSQADFDRAMPEEFWREVVDRVACEVPGTLLLAEAFWLMEGYFVRTLGMHRVYNSAFMNMLRDEENAKYRSVLKNTLEFDPEILKRYVNFMSNPDERTAVDQFGKGDKCFGVAALMATLPGLPMFGHGQIEGFTEKYGMEFRRARYEEQPDAALVERHQRQLAPLLHQRALFAESRDFLLYDFYRPDGSVDENVFAYSNRLGDRKALIVYHNRYAETRGTIRVSAAYADKSAGHLRQRELGEAFGLPADGGVILAFRDALTGLAYLRRSAQLAQEGLFLGLHAYQCHAFLDWRELRPSAQYPWDRLCDHLGGRGVPSLDEAMIELELAPAHDALLALFDTDLLHALAEYSSSLSAAAPAESSRIAAESGDALLVRLQRPCLRFFREALAVFPRRHASLALIEVEPQLLWKRFCTLLRQATALPQVESSGASAWPPAARFVLPSFSPPVAATAVWGPVLACCLLRALAASLPVDAPPGAIEYFDRLRLRSPLARAFSALGAAGEDAWRAAARVRIVFAAEIAARETSPHSAAGFPRSLWDDPDARWLLGLHEAGGHAYFNQELHEQLLWWCQLPRLMAAIGGSGKPAAAQIDVIEAGVESAVAQAEKAGFAADVLLRPARRATREASRADRLPSKAEN